LRSATIAARKALFDTLGAANRQKSSAIRDFAEKLILKPSLLTTHCQQNSFKESHPEIPWEEAVAMRAKLFHDYFEIDMEIVWKTAARNIPILKKILNQITLKKP